MAAFAIIISIVFSCYANGFLFPDQVNHYAILKEGDTLKSTCVLESASKSELTIADLYFISIHMDEISVNSDSTLTIVGKGLYILCTQSFQHDNCTNQSVTYFPRRKYNLNIVSDTLYEIESDQVVIFPKLVCIYTNMGL